MQACSKCNAQSPDVSRNCIRCGADLDEFSSTSVARKRYQANPRVKMVRLIVMNNACPACMEVEGTYAKDSLPTLPVEGCSHDHGCRCFYQPYLDEIYP